MKREKYPMLIVLVLVLTLGLSAVTAQAGVVYGEPAGGWTYIYSGDQDTFGPTNNFDSLDGTWDHENGSDLWTDPGKVTSNGDVLTITDNLTTGNDRKFYFAHNLANEGAPDDVIDSGVTLCFRARGSYYMHNVGKGNIGIRQIGGASPALVSFAFNPDGGGHLDVTDGTTGDAATPLYTVNVTVMHEYWMTIQADASEPGKTHRVTLWMDGNLDPMAQMNVLLPNTSEGHYNGSLGPDINYLTMGCGSSLQTGYLEVDFLAYRIGSAEPPGNRPPVVNAGSDQTIRYPYQRATQLSGSVEDDDPCGLGQLTILWSQISDPPSVQFDDDTDPCAVVTIPGTGTYLLVLQAWDELLQLSYDDVTIKAKESLVGDLNGDYKIDFNDVKLFTEQWLASAGCVGYITGCADLASNDGVAMDDFAVLAGNWDVVWPTVSISATDANAAEEGQDAGIFTVSRDNTKGNVIVHYSIAGTADSNDYNEPLIGQVTILNGQPSKTITITPVDDGEIEGIESVELALLEASGYIIGSPDSATVAILDNETATLESATLLVELTEAPYSFRVIEKASYNIILNQSETQFELPGGTYTPRSAYNITKTASTMEADLDLAGTTKTGHVEFTFEQPDLLKVVLSCNDDTPENIKEEFTDQGEHYYGIWEYPQGGNIDNRGADYDLIGFGGMPNTNYANARAPFYITTRNYGIYVETVALGHYSIANGGRTSFDFDEDEMTYYVLHGAYGDIFAMYNDLAGPAWMPPDWAFDSVWWRDDDHADLGHWDLVENRTIDSAQDNVEATANHLRYYKIPASAIWIDRPYTSGSWGWGNNDFNPASDWFPSGTPNGQAMINYLENKGYHLLLWIANRCAGELYTEGSALGYLFGGDGSAADVRRPEVYDWFKGKLNNFVNMGVRGYKIDRGHEHEMGSTWEEHNAVENEVISTFTKLAAEGQIAIHGSDYLIHARNAFDKSRKYVGVWNGDTDSDFGGLAVSIKNGLRCGAINFPYYGSDTGGYLSDYPSQELFTRWFQFSTYCTMMETLIDPHRTVWYDDDFPHNAEPNLIDIARKQCEEHHDLIPYTKSCMYEAHQTGMPVMRQMIFEFPYDSNLYDMWDEYMYGPGILVAPVVTGGTTSRYVYLPAGKWLDYNDKDTTYTGPDTITASAPIDVIPLFVREGAVITRGDILRSNNNWTLGWAPYLRIEFFPYDNTANTFDYYTGSNVRPIACSMSDISNVDISFLDLGYGGTLDIYCRAYTNVTKNGIPLVEGVDFTYDPAKNLMTIPFSGPTTVEITGVQSIFNPD